MRLLLGLWLDGILRFNVNLASDLRYMRFTICCAGPGEVQRFTQYLPRAVRVPGLRSRGRCIMDMGAHPLMSHDRWSEVVDRPCKLIMPTYPPRVEHHDDIVHSPRLSFCLGRSFPALVCLGIRGSERPCDISSSWRRVGRRSVDLHRAQQISWNPKEEEDANTAERSDPVECGG